jgi:hypothetical protein
VVGEHYTRFTESAKDSQISAVSHILNSGESERTKDRMMHRVAKNDSLHVTSEELQRSAGVDDLRTISHETAVKSQGNEYLLLDADLIKSVTQERCETAAAMQHVASQQSAAELETFIDDLSTFT